MFGHIIKPTTGIDSVGKCFWASGIECLGRIHAFLSAGQ